MKSRGDLNSRDVNGSYASDYLTVTVRRLCRLSVLRICQRQKMFVNHSLYLFHWRSRNDDCLNPNELPSLNLGDF